MRLVTTSVIAAITAIALPLASAPAIAQAATAADAQAASKFVDNLSGRVFTLLKDKSISKPKLRMQFRAMLSEAFALDDIGARLIRRYRSQITPAQFAAYQAALPDFALNAYSDRLMNYSDASVTPVRTLPRGTRSEVDVYSRVSRPGSQPFEAIWTVRREATGFKVVNLTISGINLALTQEADFSAYISKNGFDALIAFLKSSNAKAAA